MNKNKFLRENADPRFFDLPVAGMRSRLVARKFRFSSNKIEDIKPKIYICNKTCKFDRELVSHFIKCDFVFLKDEIVKKFYLGSISKDEIKELSEQIKLLDSLFVSVVIFPEFNITIFGDSEPVCKPLTDFLFDLKADIRFICLAGTYFIAPIWANSLRKGSSRFVQQLSLSKRKISELTKSQFHEKFNDFMPASASVYALNFPTELAANKLADGIEKIVYCCPNCGKLFSVYSELNCLKCRECGSAAEFQPDSTLLSKNATYFDELKDFQLSELNSFEFKKTPLVEYESIMRCERISADNFVELSDAKLSIYADKLLLEKNNFSKTIPLKNIVSCEPWFDNTYTFLLKNNEQVTLRGKNNENLYIILDLIEVLYKSK